MKKRRSTRREDSAIYFLAIDKRRKRNREGIGKAQRDFLEERRKQNINTVAFSLTLFLAASTLQVFSTFGAR